MLLLLALPPCLLATTPIGKFPSLHSPDLPLPPLSDLARGGRQRLGV